MIMSLPLGSYTVFPQIGTCNADLIKACTGSKLLISTPCVSKLLQSLHQMAFVEVEVLKRRVGCNVLLSFFQKIHTLTFTKTLECCNRRLAGGDSPSLRPKTHWSFAEGTIAAFASCIQLRLVKGSFSKWTLVARSCKFYHN